MPFIQWKNPVRKAAAALNQIRSDLRPPREDDPKYREYLSRIGASGLQTVALVEIAAPAALYLARLAVIHDPAGAARLWQAGAMALAGAFTFSLLGLAWTHRHMRLAAWLSAWAAPTLLIWTSLWKPAGAIADDYALASITLVLLSAAATVPFRPLHVFTLGAAIEAVFILSNWFAGQARESYVYVHNGEAHIFLGSLTLLATGIAAANYRHRRTEYETAQEAVHVAEALAGAQLRAQLAENAISIGKLAAALSHEINSPMGALKSSVATLMTIMDRQAEAPPGERERLSDVRAELRRSIDESVSRIDDVTQRLRRFVSLEDAELKAADINDLLTDVTSLHRRRIDESRITLDFDLQESLPQLTCRPQLLSAVFSSLLNNAIDVVDGEGRISISTRLLETTVEVTIRDNGRGMRPDEVETIFAPSFKVAGSRVASGNWSLFNTRQMVYEHGGEIHLESVEGKGSAFHVTLPVG